VFGLLHLWLQMTSNAVPVLEMAVSTSNAAARKFLTTYLRREFSYIEIEIPYNMFII
jgi:hypothetical protein